MSSLQLFSALLVVFLPALIYGQSSQLTWAPEEIENPLINPQGCGLNTNKPSYVCDPNALLGEHVDSINWILRDAAHNSTRCPCSNFYCETEKGPKGYRIGIAIVQKMKKQIGLDGNEVSPIDMGQLFAYRLESELWNMGNCEEDIIIFYSHDDQVLTMYAGSTAQRRLTPFYRGLLSYRAGSYLKEGRIIEGFNNLLFDLKHILNCDTNVPNGNCGLNEIRNSSSFISASLLFSLFAAISAVVFKLF